MENEKKINSKKIIIIVAVIMLVIIIALLIYNLWLKNIRDEQLSNQDVYTSSDDIENLISQSNQNTQTSPSITDKTSDEDNTDTKSTSFTATVIESNSSNKSVLMVQPDEGTQESISSDKISVKYTNSEGKTFKTGSKVKIQYNGVILESYPAQITATKVEESK